MLAIWFSGSSASADILIESHRGDRPADADRVLGPIRDELYNAGVNVRPSDVIDAAGEQLPLSGVSDPALKPNYPFELSGQVELGTKQVFHGDYNIGITTLESVLEDAHKNPAMVVVDPASMTWLTKTYAVLAFAHLRKQQIDDATKAITEQFRSFPGNPIGRIVGPEVAALSESTYKSINSAPHGTLRIVVPHPDVQIFVNEAAQGRDRAFLRLLPGKYRLLFLHSKMSRRRTAIVTADHEAGLFIDWDADAAFTTNSAWIGFAWRNGQEDRTDDAVSHYARGWPQNILVASIVNRGRRRFVVGTIFAKETGTLLRRQAIELERSELRYDEGTCLRALARYLVNEDPSDCWVDPREDEVQTGAPPAPGDPYLLPSVVGGAGLVAVLGGITLLISKSGPPVGQEDTPFPISWPGVGLMAGGGLAIGAATYLVHRAAKNDENWKTALRHSRAPVYVAAGTAAVAFAAGGYLLDIDGRGTCGRPADQCRYIYGSAPHGWAMIGAGVAAVGFGVYWRLSAPDTTYAPSLSLTPTRSGALASIGGRF